MTTYAEASAWAKAYLPTSMIGKLGVSLLIDLAGVSSYLLPVVGETFDLAWAPVSMVLVGALYDDVMPNLKYVALAEELLPFTDVTPSATIGWCGEFGPVIAEKIRETQKNVRREKRR